MSKREDGRPPVNPRGRSSLYGLGALYLAYLYYQIARPFLTRDPYGPTALMFGLGTVILGGGAIALGLLAWKMYKTPLPEEPMEEESAEEDTLPEEDHEEDSEQED